MSPLDRLPHLNLKLYFASLKDIRRAVEEIYAPPLLARDSTLSFTTGPLDHDWITRKAREWDDLGYRIWGLFYRPASTPRAVMLEAHTDTISNMIYSTLNCDALFIRSSGEASGHTVAHPIQEFAYYQRGDKRRIVRAMDDEPWEFFEWGERFDWEETNRYSRRLKKDRLTRGMIVDYARHFGVDIDSEALWRSDHDALYFVYDFPLMKARRP